jgi:hypothetical protein
MRAFKDCAVVVWRDLDTIPELKATRTNGIDGLFGRHTQFGRWTTRLP